MTLASHKNAPAVMESPVPDKTRETKPNSSTNGPREEFSEDKSPGRFQPPAKTSGLLINIVIPLLILAFGAGVIAVLGTKEADSRVVDDDSLAGRLRRLPSARAMKVLSLEELGKPLELRVDGVVVPYREIAIAAEVSGRVIQKSPQCETGRYVRKGQLLVEIDPTDYEQEVDRLTRAREQDYEALKEVDQEIINGKRLVEVANDDVTLQEREVDRLESLPSGFASEGELDRAKKLLLTAVQSRISFENQLNLLAARRSKLEAAERLATTQLRSAEINLERTKIYSPVDGVVVQENAELNSFIQRGSPIATLNDVSKAEVAVNLRMDQLHWVLDQGRNSNANANADKTGEQSFNLPGATAGNGTGSTSYSLPPTPAIVEYEIAGRSNSVFRWNGTLVRYDGIGLDPQSRTVPVVIVVDNPQKFEGGRSDRDESNTPSPLVRGMFVTVRLVIKPKTQLVAIPSIAIQPGNRVWHFVPDDQVLVEQASNDNRNTDNSVANNSSEQTPESSKAKLTSAKQDTSPKNVADDFDATKWQAGRVIIRRDVTPVDSLYLSESDNGRSQYDESRSDSVAERRYWICEIPSGKVKGGDWIISSPLGDFDDELVARVPTSDLE